MSRSLSFVVSLGLMASAALGAAGARARGGASEARGTAVAARALPSPSGEAGAIIERLRHIDRTLVDSTYAHVTRVDEAAGSYEFDCSGMVTWVLSRSAPGAYGAIRRFVGERRPLARDFHRYIAAVRAKRPQWAWSRVERVSDAQPGDVIAWIKPDVVRSPYTGHVAFIVERPSPVRDQPGTYLVRIADASSYRHQDDTREGTGRTGFGFGTILVAADPATDTPLAYGWVGLQSAWIFPTDIAIGRPRH